MIFFFFLLGRDDLLLFSYRSKNENQRNTHPSNYFALLVHADVMITLFPSYSDVAAEGFRLDDKKS